MAMRIAETSRSPSNTIKFRLIVFMLLTLRPGFSQNLVPNWSFEIHSACPNSDGQLNLAIPWFLGPSTDLFDSCSTYCNVPYVGGAFYDTAYAKNGRALIGMHVFSINYREYAQVKLLDTLKKDGCYFIEFFTRRQGITPYAINNIAANLSPNPYTSSNYTVPLNVPMHITRYNNPIIKDTNNWVQVAGIYSAAGDERYITIGNFRDNQNTQAEWIHPTSPFGTSSYYFIDAVSVYSINPTGPLPWANPDASVTQGDSVFIGNAIGGSLNSNWYSITGNFIKFGSGIYVSPSVTTQYVVQYTICGTPRYDTLKVTVTPKIDTGIDKASGLSSELTVYPVPTRDHIEIKFNDENLLPRLLSVAIFDSFGRLIQKEEYSVKSKPINIETKNIGNGIYFLQFKTKDSRIINKEFVISR